MHMMLKRCCCPLFQATPTRKAQEVTCWLVQAYDELLEGWDSTEGESYSERYHVGFSCLLIVCLILHW